MPISFYDAFWRYFVYRYIESTFVWKPVYFVFFDADCIVWVFYVYFYVYFILDFIYCIEKTRWWRVYRTYSASITHWCCCCCRIFSWVFVKADRQHLMVTVMSSVHCSMMMTAMLMMNQASSQCSNATIQLLVRWQAPRSNKWKMPLVYCDGEWFLPREAVLPRQVVRQSVCLSVTLKYRSQSCRLEFSYNNIVSKAPKIAIFNVIFSFDDPSPANPREYPHITYLIARIRIPLVHFCRW